MIDDRLTQVLASRLATLEAEVAGLEEQRRQPLAADFAEQAEELALQDAMGGIEAAHLAEAAGIRAALARIADGSYGLCEACGGAIAPARLQALPTASRCIACAE